jgi:hypothetical protein
MPWPLVLRIPFSTLDIIFYVRGGKFMFLFATPSPSHGALPPSGWVRSRRQR